MLRYVLLRYVKLRYVTFKWVPGALLWKETIELKVQLNDISNGTNVTCSETVHVKEEMDYGSQINILFIILYFIPVTNSPKCCSCLLQDFLFV